MNICEDNQLLCIPDSKGYPNNWQYYYLVSEFTDNIPEFSKGIY